MSEAVRPGRGRLVVGLFFVAILGAMTWATWTASLDRSVATAAVELWGDLWGRATLVDAYCAFLTVFLWIVHRERHWGRSALWLVALVTLGSLAIAVYFLTALVRLAPGESWHALFTPVRGVSSTLEEQRS